VFPSIIVNLRLKIIDNIIVDYTLIVNENYNRVYNTPMV